VGEVWSIRAIMHASTRFRLKDRISAGHSALASAAQAFLPASAADAAAAMTTVDKAIEAKSNGANMGEMVLCSSQSALLFT
jgi:hypothetical protein